MLSEASIAGVFLAPIVIYTLVAALIFGVCRSILGLTGLLRLAWHPALFEVALFVSILSLLVLYF